MTERIGLEAVLSLGSFSHAVSQYNSAISGMSKNTASTASSISSSFVGVGAGILKVGAIAAGAGLAGIAALTGGLILLGSAALTEFAKYERMSLSIESLVARQLSQGEQVETQRTVAIGLTKKEAEELGGLAEKIKEEELSRNTLRARIQEQSEALRQLRDAHGADALDVQTATARLAEMEHQYQTSGAEIQQLIGRQSELSDGTQNYATVIEKVRTGQMSMTEAMAQAGPKAKELLGWISKLAINSPFSEEGVNQAFQTALAYGFTIDKAKELTAAELDFAAATGKGVEVTNMIALALGQMQAKGKVSGQEIIQLTNAGIGVNKILEDMGFTLDDVSAGLVDSDKFIQAVIDDMNVFKGAGAAQAGTFSGLISTLGDLKAIGLREFFTGTFTTIQPYLADFVGMLTSAALETGRIRELGDVLGTYVAAGIQKVVEFGTQLGGVFAAFQTGGGAGLLGALGITPDAIILIEKFRTMITQIADTIAGPFMTAFSDLSAGGILESINQSITFLNDHFAELQGALLGIGAVLAAGVFAAIAAGLFALLTPINLIIVAAATLGAAWAGNWGGIREIVGSTVAYISEQFNALMVLLAPSIASLQESFGRLSEALGLNQASFSSFTDILGLMGSFIIETLIPAWVQWIGFLAGVAATAFSAWVTYVQAVYNGFQSLSSFIQTSVVPAFVSIGDALQPLQDLFVSFNELGIAVVNKSSQAMAGLWQNVLWPALQKVGKFLQDSLMPSFTSIGQTVKGDVSPALRDFGDTVLPLLSDGLEIIIQAVKDLIGFFKALKDAANSIVFPDVLMPGSPPPMAYAFMDIAAGASQATKAISGMQQGMISSASSALNFIDDLNMGGLARGFGTGGGQWRNFRNILKNEIMAGMGGLADGSINIMDKIQDVAARFNFPPQMAAEFAQMNGLVEHLTGNFSAFQEAMNLENIGNMLGLGGSFSSLGGTLAGKLEEQMAGAEAAKKTVEAYRAAVDKLTTTEGTNRIALDKKELAIEKATEALGFGQRQMDIYAQELATLMLDEEGNALQIEKKVLQMDRLTESMDSQSKQLTTLKEELGKLTGEMEKNQAAVAKAEASYKALQAQAAVGLSNLPGTIADDIASIEVLRDFLAGTGETFTWQVDENSASWTWDRVRAQEELNRLLAEQTRREELITQQKEAQQKLDFLKSQLDLINLGRQLGGNIFAGMKFGLDASVEDLLAATNAVTMAMIDQINTDLQIHSPSGVMIKTFKQVMAGAAIGLERGQSLLSEAVRSIPLLNGSISQPVFSQRAGAGNTNNATTNNYFNMDVQTGANPAAVIRQYEVARSMV